MVSFLEILLYCINYLKAIYRKNEIPLLHPYYSPIYFIFSLFTSF